MTTNKWRIKDVRGFKSHVFGADCFLQYFPELTTTGVELRQKNEFFYIVQNGKIVNETTFFNHEEMKYLEFVEG